MIVITKGKEEVDSILFRLRDDDVVKYKRFPFQNWIYVDYDQIDTALFMCKRFIDKISTVVNGGKKYGKLFLKNNYQRKRCSIELKDGGIKTYEDDINSVKRFYINNPKVNFHHDSLKKAYMDIETFDMLEFRKDERDLPIADTPITCIALKCHNTGKEWFFRNHGLDNDEFEDLQKETKRLIEIKDNIGARKLIMDNIKRILEFLSNGERLMLIEYYKVVDTFDSLLAYNGNKFDFTYINQRMGIQGLDYYKHMIIDLDYMVILKKDSFWNLRRWGLNAVAKYVFKDDVEDSSMDTSEVTKIDWKKSTNCKKYFELFFCYPELMKEYNLQDVRLMYMMEHRLGFVKIHELQSELCHCPIEDTIYNSRMCDFLMLNERFNTGMIADSKPDANTVRIRQLVKPGGGFTFCNFPGVWDNVECFDFLSHYPTSMINFNISPEKYVKDVMPDLSRVFNSEEISFINFCVSSSKLFINKKGKFDKKKYELFLSAERVRLGLSFNMWDLMWKFVEVYNVEHLGSDFIITPADINFGTRGWIVHPHRFFRKDGVGVVTKKISEVFFERLRIKKVIKGMKKNGGDKNEIKALNFKQNALKILINSLYGYFGYRNSRDYLFALPDSITSTCRFITKTVMLRGRDIGLVPVWGDTDSAYFVGINGEKLDIKTIDGFFFDFFKVWFEQFNTIVSFEKVHPVSGELLKVCHTTEFNHEKSIVRSIDIVKKRYFYKGVDGGINIKGASALKSDTLKVAAEMSLKIAKSVLNETFDAVECKKEILELKRRVYAYELEDDDVFKFMGISKPLDDYGKPVISGVTGKPKVKKNGSIQMSPVPCHIILARKLRDSGVLVDVGEKIGYVIVEHKPRNLGVLISDYEENKRYDADYYWKSIESSIQEVLEVVIPNTIYSVFSECWSSSVRVQARLLRELTARFISYELIKVFGDMSKYCPMEMKVK